MDWRRPHVAADRSHHVVDGHAAYHARFHEVLAFHEPGLAAARGDDGAMHIDGRGVPAYPARFERTFGFYEGRAAVRGRDGWFHILPDGAALYEERYGWCGNYQSGRCAVRDLDAGYLHLGLDGRPAYGARWRYAGDYRDGHAVVQREDGLHGHVDDGGALTHGRWFVDLDVFHKGFARARDRRGWTHVDQGGDALYEARYAAVEPFYNGHARVERVDGALTVIDEAGVVVVELRGSREDDFAALSRDLVGFWRTDTIAAAVELGVFEAMPGTAAELARRLEVDPERLGALLGALCELSLVDHRGDTWVPTDRGRFLGRDHACTLADAAREYAGPLRRRWTALPVALRDREWQAGDVFVEVAAEPARVISHHRMLRSYARHDYPAVAAALRLRGDERVLDVGGGLGVLAELLLAKHPALQVTVLDRPEVVAQIGSSDRRLHRVAADLFGSWSVESDAAVLARLLHDWDDERAIRILRNVRSVLPRGGRLFIVEMLVADCGRFGGLCDLHLLMSTGGRERTADAYGRLLGDGGFDVTEVRVVDALPAIIEAVAR